MTTSTVCFTLPCYPEAWDASYDGEIATTHGCSFVSEATIDGNVSVSLTAPDMASAIGFTTAIFSCDESCTAEELMIVS